MDITNFDLDDLDIQSDDNIILNKDKKSSVKANEDKVLQHDLLSMVNNASKPTASKKEKAECKELLAKQDEAILKDIMPEISNLYLSSKKDMVQLLSTFGIQERSLSIFKFAKLDLKNNGKYYPVLYKEGKKRTIKLPNEIDTLFYRDGADHWSYSKLMPFELMYIRGYDEKQVAEYNNKYYSPDVAQRQTEFVCKEYAKLNDNEKKFLAKTWDQFNDNKHYITEVSLFCKHKLLYIDKPGNDWDIPEQAIIMLNYDNFLLSDFGEDISSAKKSKLGLNKFISNEYNIKLPAASTFAKYNGYDALLYTLPIDQHERKSNIAYDLEYHGSTFYDISKYVDSYKMKSKVEYNKLTSVLGTLFLYTNKITKSSLLDRFDSSEERFITARLNIGNNYIMVITIDSTSKSEYYDNMFKIYLIDNRDHSVITQEEYLDR